MASPIITKDSKLNLVSAIIWGLAGVGLTTFIVIAYIPNYLRYKKHVPQKVVVTPTKLCFDEQSFAWTEVAEIRMTAARVSGNRSSANSMFRQVVILLNEKDINGKKEYFYDFDTVRRAESSRRPSPNIRP